MSWLISRPINGISINGKEYVLDEKGNEMVFDTMIAAKEFLAKHGYTEFNIELNGIDFEEVANNGL